MNKSVWPLMLMTLAACGTKTPLESANPLTPVEVVPPASLSDGAVTYDEWSATAAQVSDSLQRLADLDLLEVGEMIVDAPDASPNCYGPCADDPVDQAWMQEHALQAARLEAFVAVAEEIALAPAEASNDVQEAVDALNALDLVEIEGPHYESDGSCYVSVCPGDDEKRGRIEDLAEAAQGL